MSSNNPTKTMKRKVSSQDNNVDISEVPLPPWKKIRVPGDDITLPIYQDSKPFAPFPEEIELLMKDILEDLDPQSSPPASPMHSEDETDESEEASHHVARDKNPVVAGDSNEATNHCKGEEEAQINPTALCDGGKKV
ncbi:uncharacterized protein FMAN_15248 [Fusarium mangiferae]|uniref:Uncharacterized protein n=1 Tax=Fusarium mangiferae TaxID=192010 RepID=A0A1L7UGD7_FUSMA|nr:uncharacterized protein FMAN_15248 [Fusarium mangiferae]CVL07075.1 uncharacterized protein FMAN_15248 [Fusarium mangiferae]